MKDHPLYSRVKKIFDDNAVKGRVRANKFNCIRNQASVRAILDDMGCVPSTPINPDSWSLKSKVSKLTVSDNESRKQYYLSGAAKTTKASEIRRRFYAGEVINVDEQEVSRLRAMNLMYKIRSEGHKVKINRVKGMRGVISFQSDE